MQPKLHPIFYIKMDNQDTTNLTNPVPTGDAVEFNINVEILIPYSQTLQRVVPQNPPIKCSPTVDFLS